MPDTRLFADAKEVTGYLNAGDERTGKPSVVVLHEFWGLTDFIRRTVDRLAKEGFVAFAPDLYHGRVAKTREEATELKKHLDKVGGVDLELHVTADVLRHRDPNSKLGVLGFCMGGALALMAGAHEPMYDAVVPYYGIPDHDKADLSKIQGRVQAHFALDDDWCNAERIADLERRLATGRVGFEIHRYDAKHAFANHDRPEVYSEANAALAWTRTVKFLHDVLG
ncbi:MAG: dienelactone hydrolase family protein [Myxococcaceae bacterium]